MEDWVGVYSGEESFLGVLLHAVRNKTKEENIHFMETSTVGLYKVRSE